MNPHHHRSHNLQLAWRRRGFLALVLGLPLIPANHAAAEPPSEAALATRVIEVVRAREGLVDVVSKFRAGGSPVIEEAMQQYRQVMEEFADAPKARLLALRWALSLYISEPRRAGYAKGVRNHHLDGSVTSFGVETYKCNKLVADAYAVGAGAGLSTGRDWNSPGDGLGWPALREGELLWPPKANELARAHWNIRSLTDARLLRQPGEDKAKPELGDLIAFPSEGEFGHVGLYVGKNLILSAKETGLEIGSIEAEAAAHGGIVRIRKFNGSGR